MDTVKSRVFNYLTSSQKSDLCQYISKFVKKHLDKTTDEILTLFIEEEKHYLELEVPRFPWIGEYLDQKRFLNDLTKYVKDNQFKYAAKERQKPIIEKQKAYEKQRRKDLRDFKMSKEPPTKAQIAYYKALCKKYGIDINSIDLEKASKLDLRNAINGLLNEEHKTGKENILQKLNKIIEEKEE